MLSGEENLTAAGENFGNLTVKSVIYQPAAGQFVWSTSPLQTKKITIWLVKSVTYQPAAGEKFDNFCDQILLARRRPNIKQFG